MMLFSSNSFLGNIANGNNSTSPSPPSGTGTSNVNTPPNASPTPTSPTTSPPSSPSATPAPAQSPTPEQLQLRMHENPLVQLTSILSYSNLSQRCAELNTFINVTPLNDLSLCYPTIVENIFGFRTYLGWGLRGLTRQGSPKDAESTLKLLGPEGPIIQLSYRLMCDPNIRYEFPLGCLPVSVERRICRNEIPNFFPKTIPFKYSGGFRPHSMLLNPFEYYFFVFAAVQLGTRSEQNSYLFGWANLNDSVYTNLLDEFLDFFLPCSGLGVPPIQLNQSRASDSSYVANPFNQRGNRMSMPDSRPQMRTPKLLKASVLQDDSLNASVNQRELAFSQEFSAANREIWRSETMMTTFIIMWLNVDASEGLGICQFETILPSVELVKSVRIIVRHFHFFNNMISTTVLHPLEEIRRNLYPIFQKKLYSFLRYLFGHWPMDSSFRIVYETWLSYIQPWRYLSYESGGVVRDRDEVQIDQRWHNFIVENILFYTMLLQDMLIRLARSDLSAYRTAHMLFRISKIFTSQKILRPTLKELDYSLHQLSSARITTFDYASPAPVRFRNNIQTNCNINLFSVGKSGNKSVSFAEPVFREQLSEPRVGLITTSPTSFTSPELAQLKQVLREFEGQHFNYTSLFSSTNRDLVHEILNSLDAAKEEAKAFIANSGNQSPPKKVKTFWSSIFPSEESETPDGTITNKVTEKEKVLNLLDSSKGALAGFFEILIPGNMGDSDAAASNFSLIASEASVSTTDLIGGGDYIPRPPSYVGNPDQSPLRADENATAVRILSIMSQLLNFLVVPLIRERYYARNFGGAVLRSAFAKPQFYHELQKRGPGRATKVLKYLPPRIVLRPLGCTLSIINVCGCIFAGFLLGVQGYGWFFWPLLAYFIYILVRTSFEPEDNLPKLRSEFQGLF